MDGSGTGVGPDEEAPGIHAVNAVRAAASQLFGDRLELAVRYADLLGGSAVERGLIGPREVPRLWDRHLLNCAAVAEVIPEGSRVVDVGSGAGLPGIALAIARPDLRVSLLEPLQRRVNWLSEAVTELGLSSVTVCRGRAEEASDEVRDADVVTARAVAALDRLVVWCLPLARPGGVLLALKGQAVAEELSTAEPALRRLSARRWQVRTCGANVLDVPTTVVEIEAGDPVGRGGRRRRRGERRRR
ncbi:MAG: 16S rRNA (guanine(527)-N(7))-methyltransferase RsmG [Kineosporiaceae bacterium]|nr:16S rRNA (guanine(527)-N(7))-methyltransferase RsmG [Kineosporiaceae bacterium]MBK7623403.1 16S rRNA (guanine(527)-N(7))-methyltransferase RsmG [Kineosporiaceae bacterium]MBK8074051.1 16S rRNA (guanine(527)-N(7))-methyltransferase RsmG [Kineosporiaceae bacterium]